MKKILLSILVLLAFTQTKVSALTEDYRDFVGPEIGVKSNDETVAIYFYYGEGCPFCEKEMNFLTGLQSEYGNKIAVYKYEVWNNEDNNEVMRNLKEKANVDVDDSVPFTQISDRVFYGFSQDIELDMENQIRSYLGMERVEIPTYEVFGTDIAPTYEDGQNEDKNENNDQIQSSNQVVTKTSFDIHSWIKSFAIIGFLILELSAARYLIILGNTMNKKKDVQKTKSSRKANLRKDDNEKE